MRLLAVALNLTCCVVICMADDAAVPALSEKTQWVRVYETLQRSWEGQLCLT